jgi:hypothetical protein
MPATQTQRGPHPPKALERERETLILQRRAESEHPRFGEVIALRTTGLASDPPTATARRCARCRATTRCHTVSHNERHPNLSSGTMLPKHRNTRSFAIHNPCQKGSTSSAALKLSISMRATHGAVPPRTTPLGRERRPRRRRHPIDVGFHQWD